MKRIIFFILLFFYTSSAIYAEKCYLAVENPGQFDPKALFSISSSLISQYFVKVEQIPNSGIGIDDCLYTVSSSGDSNSTLLTLTGQKINAFGESKLKGVEAMQEAVLKAILRANIKQRDKICDSYASLLKEECEEEEEYDECEEEVYEACEEGDEACEEEVYEACDEEAYDECEEDDEDYDEEAYDGCEEDDEDCEEECEEDDEECEEE